MEIKRKLLWILFGLSAIGVGLYPITYTFLNSPTSGLLASKPRDLIANAGYMTAFYMHIGYGGLALLTGWSQFLSSWRRNHPSFHRVLGYVYIISVLVSSITGFIIALYSSGGTVASIGFGMLAVLWFTTILLAFINIKRGAIKEHQKWMIRNYSMTFAAVTLRIYLPIVLFASGNGIEFTLQVVSWVAWVPNIIVAEGYIQREYGIFSPMYNEKKLADLQSIHSEMLALERENA